MPLSRIRPFMLHHVRPDRSIGDIEPLVVLEQLVGPVLRAVGEVLRCEVADGAVADVTPCVGRERRCSSGDNEEEGAHVRGCGVVPVGNWS